MPILDKIPKLDICCGCITDLKTAAAIIAVLGIVTSPAVSWAILRHAYVIRVSCAVSAKAANPEIVDINLSNGLSFGFGANSGLGLSCLSKPNGGDKSNSSFVMIVKSSGWIVLAADIVFLFSSMNLLTKLFQGPDKNATFVFLVAGLVSILLTFVYGMLYVTACVYVGGGFPLLEFLFAIVDLLIWMYFLLIMNSYYRLPSSDPERRILAQTALMMLGMLTIYGFLTNTGILRRRAV